MPRLLLVDDNPSIHKIAETLLAASDVQLVSCGSGAEAMALVDRGDRFDVALLDTSMLGMDGWALLRSLRASESTARMPVAMMAGVLDSVDPEQLRLAPIQGFLKKPVELRDLVERIKRLIETPVPAPPEPRDQDDLLLLGPEDLAEQESLADEPLELEELDLEGLQDITFPVAALPAMEEPEAAPAGLDDAPEVPEFLLADTLPETSPDPQGYVDQLPDLGPASGAAQGPGNLLDLGGPIDWADDSDALVGMALGGPEPSLFLPDAAPSALTETPLGPMPELITLSDILDPPADPRLPDLNGASALPPSATAQATDVVPDPLAALLADPALLDRLAKALVARLGDQVLREIAWEVMPELAKRLHQEAP